MVKTTPLAELVQKIQRNIDEGLSTLTKSVMQPAKGFRLVPDGETRQSWCLRYTFSDTIILISDDDSEEACLRLLLYAFRMLQYLTVIGFPARGGISFGEAFVDIERRLFLGKSLIDAYELERMQDWVGCTISESAEKRFPNLFRKSPILENVFPFYEVPLKAGPVKRLRTINWRWFLTVQDGCRKLFKSTENWPERRKVENTFAYLQFIRSTGKAYPKKEELNDEFPLELHAAFAGNGPPPPNALPTYPHGDDL